MEDTILGVPKVAVYFVLAIVLPIIIFVGFMQFVVFISLSRVVENQTVIYSKVDQLIATPSATMTPIPTVIIEPTEIVPSKKPVVKSATKSGQVK